MCCSCFRSLCALLLVVLALLVAAVAFQLAWLFSTGDRQASLHELSTVAVNVPYIVAAAVLVLLLVVFVAAWATSQSSSGAT